MLIRYCVVVVEGGGKHIMYSIFDKLILILNPGQKLWITYDIENYTFNFTDYTC